VSRAVVNVATGHFLKGQARLETALRAFGETWFVPWGRQGDKAWPVPSEWPTHQDKPFAFKAYALQGIAGAYDADEVPSTVLYVDASILPIRPLAPLWEKIERDGYLLMNNGYSNYTWTADSAYPDLFGQDHQHMYDSHCLASDRALNKKIPHLVGGVIGLDLRHEVARQFLSEYYRLASATRAFCGPLVNDLSGLSECCGPADVRGHRHDQTAASVIAWRLGCKLSNCPEFFSYAKNNSTNPADYDERTVLIAHGAY
jgi:hypothetical protein